MAIAKRAITGKGMMPPLANQNMKSLGVCNEKAYASLNPVSLLSIKGANGCVPSEESHECSTRHSDIVKTCTGLTMPITTITTTTVITSTMHMTPSGVTSTMTTMSTTVTDVVETKGKHKISDEHGPPTKNKRLLLDETEDTDVSSGDLMKRMLKEIIGLHSVVEGVDKKVEMIQEEHKTWRDRLNAVEGDLGEVKQSLEMAHNLVNDEKAERIKDVVDLRSDIAEHSKEIGTNVQLLKTQATEVKSIKSTVNEMKSEISRIQGRQDQMDKPIAELKQQIGQASDNTEYAVNWTIIAQNVWFKEEEDLMRVARTIIHKALGLEQVNILRAHRLNGRESGAGLVKIEVDKESSVKLILGKKHDLKNNPVKEIKDIYLRKSKKEETLVMERNVDLILRDMGVCDDYVRLPSGYLKREDAFSSSDSSQRGRGHPRGGRGGHGGHICGQCRWNSDV